MSLWERTLDILNRGVAASAGAAHSLVVGKNPVAGAWKGLAGEERKNYSDVLGALGMDKGLARSVLGFGADVFLDPTTYVTFGTGAGEKVAVGGVQKTLTESAQAVRKVSEFEKANQAVRVLNRLDEAGRTAVKGSLLERYGLGQYGELPNELIGKTMAERVTAEGLGRVAEGRPVSGALSELQGTKPFKESTLRFMGNPVIPEQTAAAGVAKAKELYSAAEASKGIGPILKGVRQSGQDVGGYLKKLFSTDTGDAYLNEVVTKYRDQLDFNTVKKLEEYTQKGNFAEHLQELRRTNPGAAAAAEKDILAYVQGATEIRKRAIPDAEKLRLIESNMQSLAEQLNGYRDQAKKASAIHNARIDMVKGEMRQGSMDYLGAISEHEKELGKAALKEAKEQSQFLKDQHELAYGDLKREMKSRGVGQIFGIAKEEYQANIPRQYRRKAGLGIDQWIDELKTRGKLGPQATETEFYDLIKKMHTPPAEVSAEAMAAGVQSRRTADRIVQLEAEAAARKKELAGLQEKNPTATIDPKIKELEAEIASLRGRAAASTPIKYERVPGQRIKSADPKVQAIAESIEGKLKGVHEAEQRLPLAPERREHYFPHQLKDELRPAVTKAISQDAYKMLTKDVQAALGSSQRRTYEGLVEDMTVRDMIDAGVLDPHKVQEILERKGITTTPDVMLAFEKDPIKVALARELSSIRALNAADFAHEILSSPHFVKSRIPLHDQNLIQRTLHQNPDHALFIPTKDFLDKFATPAQREALRQGGPHGKAKNLIEEVFEKALPEMVKTPQQAVQMGYVLRRETAQHLSKAYSNQFDDEAIKNFLRLWDGATSWWKMFNTIVNPGFHVRNAVSNVWQAGVLAGANNPSTWMKAMVALKDASKAAHVGKYTAEEAIEIAKRNGIIRGGFVGREIGDAIDRIVNPSSNPLSLKGPIARKGGDAMQSIENVARTSLFFDGLEKGFDVQTAINRTKKYLFDYGDLSKTEKTLMRRLIPFYTWTRKSVPLAFEALVTQPGKVAAIGKLQHEAESNVDGALESKYVSQFIRDNVGVPIGKGADGKVQYFLLGRWIPTADIAKMNPRELFGMLHPALKEPIEQAMNYNVFSGQPIEKFPGELQKLMGVTMQARVAHLARNIGVLQQLDRAFFRNDLDLVSTPASIVGMSTYGQDKAAQMKRDLSDLTHEIGRLKATETAAVQKFGEDSGITKQYTQRIADLTLERNRVSEDLAKVEPQLGTMKPRAPRSAASNPIVAKLQKRAGVGRKAKSPHVLSPKIQRIIASSGKQKGQAKVG